MKIGISCESTCDLPKKFIKENDIKILPLAINLSDKEYIDGETITSKEIFQKVDGGAPLPKTAARSVGDYVEFFNNIKKEYDIVLHIAFSSELSCSCQNAILASKEVEGVHIIDSKNLSSGHGLVVMEAVKRVKNGKNVEDIIKEVEEIVPKVRASFVVNTMAYLNKGGRCSSLTRFAASLLKIKPSIKVVDGKMVVGKKYMGKLNDSIMKYMYDTLSENPNCKKDKIFITYSSCELIDVDKMKEKLVEKGFENIYETNASCTISTHCGPNCVGILFIDN